MEPSQLSQFKAVLNGLSSVKLGDESRSKIHACLLCLEEEKELVKSGLISLDVLKRVNDDEQALIFVNVEGAGRSGVVRPDTMTLRAFCGDCQCKIDEWEGVEEFKELFEESWEGTMSYNAVQGMYSLMYRLSCWMRKLSQGDVGLSELNQMRLDLAQGRMPRNQVLWGRRYTDGDKRELSSVWRHLKSSYNGKMFPLPESDETVLRMDLGPMTVFAAETESVPGATPLVEGEVWKVENGEDLPPEAVESILGSCHEAGIIHARVPPRMLNKVEVETQEDFGVKPFKASVGDVLMDGVNWDGKKIVVTEAERTVGGELREGKIGHVAWCISWHAKLAGSVRVHLVYPSLARSIPGEAAGDDRYFAVSFGWDDGGVAVLPGQGDEYYAVGQELLGLAKGSKGLIPLSVLKEAIEK